MGMIAVVPVTVGTEDLEMTIRVAAPATLQGVVKLEGVPPANLSVSS